MNSADPFRTIAIVGAGAIGTFYGARLVLAGREVRFLMRSDLALVREQGVRLIETAGTRSLHPLQAFGSTDEIGPVDLVVITLKATANAELPRLLPSLLHARTAVLTLQNGLGNEEAVAAVVGAERVLGGLCFIAATRTSPGEVTCGHPGSMDVGELLGPARERTRAVAALFTSAGVRCTVDDRLEEARWRKLSWNIPFNGLAIAAGGLTTDRLLADPRHVARIRVLMDEVAAAARALGHDIPAAFLQRHLDQTPKIGAYRPSSLVDHEAGRPIELEAIWGEPLRRGRRAGVDLPELAALYAELQAATRR
ncbi:MAG: 2-dehydropantoate 2-reductase [Verrucomicrobia bacterium]|nr:2-dehydropantoate 2-reductase [Verrucomicrobiota bacterium]